MKKAQHGEGIPPSIPSHLNLSGSGRINNSVSSSFDSDCNHGMGNRLEKRAERDHELLHEYGVSRQTSNTSSTASAASEGSGVDEFGFPLRDRPQHLLHQQNPHHSHYPHQQLHPRQHRQPQHVTQKKDWNNVDTPSHLQLHQRRQQLHTANVAHITHANSTSFSNSASSTPVSTPSRPPRNSQPSQFLSHKKSVSKSSSFRSTESSKSHKSAKTRARSKVNHQSHHAAIKINPAHYQSYTFQHPSYAMRLSLRRVDLAHRIAFDNRPLPGAVDSVALFQKLEDMETVSLRGNRSVGSVASLTSSGIPISSTDNLKKNPCPFSPSPNHLAILEFIHKHTAKWTQGMPTVARQLQWNEACSVDADPWYDLDYEVCNDEYPVQSQPNEQGKKSSSTYKIQKSNKLSRPTRRRRPRNAAIDQTNSSDMTTPKYSTTGHYLPINPLSTTKTSLPNHSPKLTNVKRRLPMRSDVGFANPSEDDIRIKMEEVKKESEWEECSPRIVLLVSGFTLFGSRGVDETDGTGGTREDDELHASCQANAELWTGGRIPGVPFAGRDLVQAANLIWKLDRSNIKRDASADTNNEGKCDPKKEFNSKVLIEPNSCSENSSDQRGDSNQHNYPECNPGTYSLFAPPIDATFSSSHLWRPRPFMDKPPGHVYFLACPLDIRFAIGDVEPLFCSMALYSLPGAAIGENDKKRGKSKAIYNGKISEEFLFPAGCDCNGLEDSLPLQFNEALKNTNFNNNDEECENSPSWRRRKRRAILSFDPLDVSVGSLFLVIQVNKLSQVNAYDAYTRYSESSTKEDFGVVGRSPITPGAPFSRQYLTPLCFSVSPLSFGHNQWPVGHSIRTPFHYFPSVPESQDDFVESLIRVSRVESRSPKFTTPNYTDHDFSPGYSELFFSFLGGDFLQALLDEPIELSDQADDAASTLGPQLLSDIMGDRAISFDGTTSCDTNKKRSKLRRLLPTQQSGYSTSFDMKEVLYLPPRSKKYEDNVNHGYCSNINLLYVYPHLIRKLPSQMKSNKNVTLRIRLVEESRDKIEALYEPLHAMYSPLCPMCPPLVESFFTKISICVDASNDEVPLRDEVKVRLPDVLDRRHFLQFSLFSVDASFTLEFLAETKVPLIISSKEPASAAKVTTIIPNGLHRMQLGEFQIQVETRLASAKHLSDPSVATLLRDSPFCAMETSDVKRNNDAVVHIPTGVPFIDILKLAPCHAIKSHFISLMSLNLYNLVNHTCPPFYFESLMDTLISGCEWHRLVSWEKTDSLFAILKNLFEILDKTNAFYQLDSENAIISLHYQRLLKSFLDSFDESLFKPCPSDLNGLEPMDNESFSDRKFDDSLDSSFADGMDMGLADNEHPIFSGHAGPDVRVSVFKNRVKSPRKLVLEAPFSRRAYVPSRTEQLKAEAEMYADDFFDNEYFDDEETVATTATISSRVESGSVFPVILESKSSAVENSNGNYGDSVAPTLAHPTSEMNGCSSEATNYTVNTTDQTPPKTNRAKYMASRVTNVAQLVMPCMAPSLSEVITNGSGSSPRHTIGTTGSNEMILKARRGASNKNLCPYEPSSENEEDVMRNSESSLSKFRGNHSHSIMLSFHPMRGASMDDENSTPSSNVCYLYEVIVACWVQAWTAYGASFKTDEIDLLLQGSSKIIPTWPYVIAKESKQPADVFSFTRNMSFFLPLCLKSLALRCFQNPPAVVTPMTFLDESGHMQCLIPLVETIAIALMREAMTGNDSSSNADQLLLRALSNSETFLDFLVSLFCVLHPSQVSSFIFSYFKILEEFEKVSPNESQPSKLRRFACSRHLRLRAIEKLGVIPKFIALNYPPKYTGFYPTKQSSKPTWMNQCPIAHAEIASESRVIDLSPNAFWLSDLLMSQCLSICHYCCEAIILEADYQKRISKQARSPKNEEESLSRGDLARLESTAFHSILCAHELLLKRHAMDSRFQSISSNTRVAAMFVGPVLKQSVESCSLLQRMDANHKIRTTWVFCVLYVLQEGPEVVIRDKLHQFCEDEGDTIINFVRLLKLLSTTCQHLIPGVGLRVLGGLSEEATQEAFNCISASAIVLVDECINIVSKVHSELINFGKSVLDLLLHIISSPQSSITLLRALGAASHALEKLGIYVFTDAVGDCFQHWARILFCLMNSNELSVRSMAVDFFISLLAGIYNAYGSIDSASVQMLTVLPEVIAREIALFISASLIHSMEDVASSLWPLRRALADVEEVNPIDDSRIDPQLIPSITSFCRTSQAIIDGVLVEMRIKQSVGGIQFGDQKLPTSSPLSDVQGIFDADEESLLEAAVFFSPQSSLSQRLRWLFTLREVHAFKEQWLEEAETLMLCAFALIESFGFYSQMWTPSSFDLWNVCHRSPWLSSICSTSGGNMDVMNYANAFLQPDGFLVHKEQVYQCFNKVVEQAFAAFSKEEGSESLSYSHFEDLLDKVSAIISDEKETKNSDDTVFLRQIRTIVFSKIASLTEKGEHNYSNGVYNECQNYVRVLLWGKKPNRYIESTTIPTYLEWNVASICRVSKSTMEKARNMMALYPERNEEECISLAFARPILSALRQGNANESIVFHSNKAANGTFDVTKTHLGVIVVQPKGRSRFGSRKMLHKTRRFFFRNDAFLESAGSKTGITECAVAHKFPFALSRQKVIINSIFKMN